MGKGKKIKEELNKIPKTVIMSPIGQVGGADLGVGVAQSKENKPEAIIGALSKDSNDTNYLYGKIGSKGVNEIGVGKNFKDGRGGTGIGVTKDSVSFGINYNFQSGGKVEKKTKPKKKLKDPYLERNEFKPGFYDQPDKPPVTPSTYYGTASGKTSFEPPIVDPDTSMMQSVNMKEGGMVKGNGKVLKDRIKKTKYY